MRKGLAALAVVFLAAHLFSLPPTLEDLDSINFALGVREFDVARHQPHPPGYPVFIALGKIATPLLRVAGMQGLASRGLAVWSAVGGALLIPLMFALARALGADRRHAIIATVIAAACPVFWFTALRPLSDTIGLVAACAALVPIATAMGATDRQAPERARLLSIGAFGAGLAIGIRSQAGALTLPLLALAFVNLRRQLPGRSIAIAAAAFLGGLLVWAIPLVVVSGGPSGYLSALSSQAGEDFSGVVMLWTHHSAHVAALALLDTLVRPWDSPLLAGVVLALAAAGALVVLRRSLGTIFLVAVIFAPYAAFHLLFHETITVRYALPLVIPLAFFAAAVLANATRAMGGALTIGIVAYSLWLAVPAAIAFGHPSVPFFQLIDRAKAAAQTSPDPIVGMHRRVFSESRRARQWAGGLPGRVLAVPRDYEWLELTRAWHEGHDGPAWFIADPRRTDLALIDGATRRTESFRWPFNKATYVGGSRPDEVEWHVYDPPGWFLEQGWALTPEIAGVTERDGWGPHRRPSVGWIRRRSAESVMVLGGRHLGSTDAPAVRIMVTIDNRPVSTFDVAPGFFLRFLSLPPGALHGEGRYAKLEVAAQPVAGGTVARIGLEQFDVQPADAVVFGFDEGWYEPEYNPQTARSWRWMSQHAALRVHNGGHDLILHIAGESPLRYFNAAPVVRVVAGGRELAQFRPDRDFTREIEVPASLMPADGKILLESSRGFVPADRGATADRRQLALRIYSVTVRAE